MSAIKPGFFVHIAGAVVSLSAVFIRRLNLRPGLRHGGLFLLLSFRVEVRVEFVGFARNLIPATVTIVVVVFVAGEESVLALGFMNVANENVVLRVAPVFLEETASHSFLY